MRRERLLAILAALLCAGLGGQARAGEVTVAVAANFAGPLARIAEGFTAATGHVVKPSAGSTGKFYTQIVTGGAPFDVLLAADEETPRRLLAEGHAVAGSGFTYAIGQLVLWSAKPGRVDDQGAVLASTRYHRLAIANPKIAPYGRAAQQVLHSRGLADVVAGRLVTADSVAQAYQFVATGNAEIGFVALSQVIAAGRARGARQPEAGTPPTLPGASPTGPGVPLPGSLWRVPQHLYGEIRQDAVLLRAGAANPAAAALLQHLKGPAARAVMAAYGYR